MSLSECVSALIYDPKIPILFIVGYFAANDIISIMPLSIVEFIKLKLAFFFSQLVLIIQKKFPFVKKNFGCLGIYRADMESAPMALTFVTRAEPPFDVPHDILRIFGVNIRYTCGAAPFAHEGGATKWRGLLLSDGISLLFLCDCTTSGTTPGSAEPPPSCVKGAGGCSS